MDNTSSPAQLLIPPIPEGVCFTGTTTEILNQYSDQILANAIINVPGLGSVTPEQIASLEAQIQTLQNQIDALDINVRSGVGVLTTGDQNVGVTFSTEMPDTNYDIHVTIVDSTGAATAATSYALVGGTKATTGLTLRFYDIAASQTSFEWSVRQIPT